MLAAAQRQRRQHGLGQGAEDDLPAGRRRPLQDRPGRRQARPIGIKRRDGRRRRRRTRRLSSTTSGAGCARPSTRPAITAPTGTPSSRSTRSTSPASATTTSSPSCSARCWASSTSATAAPVTAGWSTNADETASLGAFYDPAYAGPGIKIVEVMARRPARQGRHRRRPRSGHRGHRRRNHRPRQGPGALSQPQGRTERSAHARPARGRRRGRKNRPGGASPERHHGQARLAARREQPALSALGPAQPGRGRAA